MFQGLQQGATLYILYKNEPRIERGRIVSANTHMPQFNPTQPMGVLNGMVTDITVSVGNETIPFAGLPASASSANFPDKGIFISEEQGAVAGELSAMRDNSQRIVDSYETHKALRDKCEALLVSFDPTKQQDARIAGLESKLDKLTGLLTAALGSKTKEE